MVAKQTRKLSPKYQNDWLPTKPVDIERLDKWASIDHLGTKASNYSASLAVFLTLWPYIWPHITSLMKKMTTLRLFVFTVLTVLLLSSQGFAQVRRRTTSPTNSATLAGPSMVAQVAPTRYDGTGWMVRLEPALFFRTAGIEVEKMITDNLSLGVNVLYKVGSGEERIVNGVSYLENHRKNTYLVEFAAKYYFEDKTPSGFYLQGHLGMGNLIYEDGTWRPIGINTSFTKYDASKRNIVPEPSVLRYGAAGGYQFLLLNKSLAVNVMAGLQCQNDTEGFKTLLFFAPSVGFYF